MLREAKRPSRLSHDSRHAHSDPIDPSGGVALGCAPVTLTGFCNCTLTFFTLCFFAGAGLGPLQTPPVPPPSSNGWPTVEPCRGTGEGTGARTGSIAQQVGRDERGRPDHHRQETRAASRKLGQVADPDADKFGRHKIYRDAHFGPERCHRSGVGFKCITILQDHYVA